MKICIANTVVVFDLSEKNFQGEILQRRRIFDTRSVLFDTPSEYLPPTLSASM